MEHIGRTSPLWVPDYSNYRRGCDYCGRPIAQVKETLPIPCSLCSCCHYCSPRCGLGHFRAGHRTQCFMNMDTDIDMRGAEVITASQALWDLRRYTARWHDELGDAAIAAMNLHTEPNTMNRLLLVVHLSYVPRQPYRMRRFRFQYARPEPLERYIGTTMNAALIRREENNIVNQRNGMVGCVLILLACDVPGVGFVFNSTFVGPEPSVLLDPPPADWQQRLWGALSKNEIP